MDASKTLLITVLITSAFSAPVSKAADVTPAMPKNPPESWLTYHLAHPGPGHAVPGDPNPAFFWKGRYHLHYIYKDRAARKKEKGRDLGPDWGHVSSTDMVHWTWHPTVLGPKRMGHGMFSGTGFFTKEGKPGIIYHGKSSSKNWISYALDDHLNQWSEPELVLPRDKDGKDITEMSYFDPDLWINNGVYYALNARSSSEPPVIMKSNNLKDWDYIGELLHPDFDEEKLGVGRDEDISCPNMFKMGDKWVLLCISHDLGCRYFIGDFKDEQFLPEQHGMMNWAAWDFFAPESLLTPDGRRVMWSWCTTVVSKKKNTVPREIEIDFNEVLAGKIQTGIQSLPRELSLSDEGTLLIKPLRELKKLRADEKTFKDITVNSDTTHLLEGISGDTMELELVLEAPSAKEFGLKVLCDQDGSDGFTISSGKGSKNLNVGYIQPPFELEDGEDLTLCIFIDKHLIEVFANDRQAAVAWHDYDADDLHISLFGKGGDLIVKRFSAWQIKSIYPKAGSGQK
jgi:beta-fructofuranosidase